jgi:hypothetical protein
MAKVTSKRPIYSPRRKANIIFDVVLEFLVPGHESEPVLLWLWECKDYPDRRVTVDEVEEFQQKRSQVDAHKGTIVTRLGFQRGAIEVAKSYRIQLMTLNYQRDYIIALSQDAGILARDNVYASYCLGSDGAEIEGRELDDVIHDELEEFFESLDSEAR